MSEENTTFFLPGLFIYIIFFSHFVFKLWLLLFFSPPLYHEHLKRSVPFWYLIRRHSSAPSFILSCGKSVLSSVDRVAPLCPLAMHLAAMLSTFALTACQSVALSAKTKYERDSDRQ